ncbi:glycoside hydrolase family 13 protein [Clostridium sp. BJN0001]|uniref:glycoside hydrolase family 13 protein n=1 Tax=Clostridium sp. BJN0001 TaxID=2930219 RepID=UPI001FD31962|nr:glycoside hydrolase family 13 protein [Clostridium sp. BJN0001]
MDKRAIYHILDTPYAYGKDKNTLSVMIRTAKSDIKECIIHYKDRYDWDNDFIKKEMILKDTDELFDYFTSDLKVYKDRYRYFFELTDFNGETLFLDERGFRDDNIEVKEATAFQYPYIAQADVYEEEKWLQEAVVYQIFVDRFYNGDKTNDPECVKKWGDKVDRYSMFGGDLQGIIDKLDYLKDLGVDLLYLTPIFKSSSNHKYNTCDYYSIDQQFGDLETAKKLVSECHKRNIKIVFDAVFNHSGSDFFAFKDIIKNGEKSKYKDWYFIDNFPVDTKKINYYTFANDVYDMPKFNTNNEEVKKYLLDVSKYWIEEVNADGWRLDVCDEVDHDFWRSFKKVVKKKKKGAIIIGEIMHEASSFLKGDQLDGIMNYPFKGACVDFFANRSIDVVKFNNVLAKNRTIYMQSITKQMWNLVGSHDTKRFLTECDEHIERMLLAILFQFTYMGVPYIYYGDEVGLTGAEEPQSRKCMIWDEKHQNTNLMDMYKKLIKIRRENKELIYGDYETLYCDKNVLAFKREYNGDLSVVIINNNYDKNNININLNGEFHDLISDQKVTINNEIELEPMKGYILKIK